MSVTFTLRHHELSPLHCHERNQAGYARSLTEKFCLQHFSKNKMFMHMTSNMPQAIVHLKVKDNVVISFENALFNCS
jgi:hypothetical protein